MKCTPICAVWGMTMMFRVKDIPLKPVHLLSQVLIIKGKKEAFRGVVYRWCRFICPALNMQDGKPEGSPTRELQHKVSDK